MSDKLHVLIPGAVVAGGDEPAQLPDVPLPSLKALLADLAPAERIDCDDHALATPFELALARAHGLPGKAGRIPWAAFDTGTVGTPCAFIQLCHWQVGTDHVILSPPEALQLDDADATRLLAAMTPYFAEDGIGLQPHGTTPGIWLATGEPLRALRSASMARLAGQRLTRSLLDAAGQHAATVRRLQNEMQMLLYTHPVNDERVQRGLLPVNSFWVTGAGVLDAPLAPAPGVQVEPRLQAAARRGDTAAHAQTWQQVDAQACARLLAVLRGGGEARLTLCGDHAAQTWGPGRNPLWRRFSSIFGRQPASSLPNKL